MDKSKLIKLAALFERQAVMLLREARRLRAMAEGKPKQAEPHEASLTVH